MGGRGAPGRWGSATKCVCMAGCGDAGVWRYVGMLPYQSPSCPGMESHKSILHQPCCGAMLTGKSFAFPKVTSQHLLATFSKFSPTSSAVLLLLISPSSYVFLWGMDTQTLVGWIFLCLPEIVLNGEDIILQHLIISNDFISELSVA